MEEHPALPLDVVQIVLGYVDTKTVGASRQACRGWRQAAAAAPCTLRVQLPSSTQEMSQKLGRLQELMPGLAGCQATVAAGADTAYTVPCLRGFAAFRCLRHLDVAFCDSLELAAADLVQLGTLTALTCLRLSSVSLPAGADSGMLAELQQLRELSLVHHSKVAALMVGDSHLHVIGRLTGLTQLVLQGRMCSTTDEGLMALASLSQLRSLSISWVPWQSQITQSAALQLLAGLTSLRSLQLGGAELLLPNSPFNPLGNVAGPAAGPGDAPMLGIGIGIGIGDGAQLQAPVAVATAAAEQDGREAAAVTAALQGEHMRSVLAAKGAGLEAFKLQFNCCGTGVEKSLLSLGDVRRQLTGLQWSYAKLSGPTSVSLLAGCSNLRSLKLRLWYQDYNLTPFDFNLGELSRLVHLHTLVLDKRPPFQQQLPAQQSAIRLPISAPLLRTLARAWPQLEKMQLGLARSDFGARALDGLAGFMALRSLSIHCYDQGYDDGHFMLPLDVACLPPSLVKLDLMHTELHNSAGGVAGSGGGGSCCGRAGGGSSHSCGSAAAAGADTVGAKGRTSSSGGARSKVGLASAMGFTSMLSESFSLLSRQASTERGASYLAHQGFEEQQLPGTPHTLGSAAGAAVAGRAAALAPPAGCTAVVSAGAAQAGPARQPAPAAYPGVEVQPSGCWLQELLSGGLGSGGGALANASATASDSVASDGGTSSACGTSSASSSSGGSGGSGGSNSSGGSGGGASSRSVVGTPSSTAVGPGCLTRQQSLPPLPRQQSLTTSQGPARAVLGARQPAKAAVLSVEWSCVAQAPAAAAQAAQLFPAAPQSRPGRLQNPFAAAAAAALVHAAVGGCVGAVDPHAHSAAPTTGPQLLPLVTEPGAAAASTPASASATASAQCAGSGGKGHGGKGNGGKLATARLSKSFSISCSLSSGGGGGPSKGGSSVRQAGRSKSAGGLAGHACASSATGPEPAGLPALQHLQLKHCSLDAISMDDIITAPAELRSVQLVEVAGLAPRDVALLPFLVGLQRLTLIAAKEDAWLGMAPLRLLSKLPHLRHLDWVVSERALSSRSKAADLQLLALFPKLQMVTLHTLLGRCEALHAVSAQLHGCHVRLMSPAYCEHAGRRSGSRISRLLGAASCLLPGASGHPF